MTERGLPIVDGAPACPFVAFDDDRDERAASPDHRHRCYAESSPAPRALAHQEAYCLSSAFPVCPTFQDWARREAARSRSDPPSRPADSVAAAAISAHPQRNPPRNWAEPPPWARSEGGAAEDVDWDGEDGDEIEAIGGSGLAGSSSPAAGPGDPGRGLSGSYADRVAGGGGVPPAGPRAPADDVEPAAQRSAPAAPAPEPMGERIDEPVEQWDVDEEPPEPPVRRRRERDYAGAATLAAASDRGGGRGAGGGGGGGGGGGRSERHRDSRAPEWERARPLEAFPTLRSRRLSEFSVPPILVGVVALALAAAVLFALPGLLGFGNPSTGGGTPTPELPVTTPIVTPAPTPIPEPTDQIYIVQGGDTMSKIAERFNIPLGDLIAANAETIPDPNKLQIGDQVLIPAQDPDELPAATEIPGAT